MRLLAFLATHLVLQTHAASIPKANVIPAIVTDVQSLSDAKIVVDQNNEPGENNCSEQELIQPAITVNDINNELRSQKVGIPIPVTIVTDSKVSLKSGAESKKEKDNEIPQEETPVEDKKELEANSGSENTSAEDESGSESTSSESGSESTSSESGSGKTSAEEESESESTSADSSENTSLEDTSGSKSTSGEEESESENTSVEDTSASESTSVADVSGSENTSEVESGSENSSGTENTSVDESGSGKTSGESETENTSSESDSGTSLEDSSKSENTSDTDSSGTENTSVEHSSGTENLSVGDTSETENISVEGTSVSDTASSLDDTSEFEDDVEEPLHPSAYHPMTIVKEALQNAQTSILLSVNSFAETIQAWVTDQSSTLPSEEQATNVKSVVDMNISKLNETVTGYFTPENAIKMVEQADDSIDHMKSVQSDLKVLETHFKNEIKSALGNAKADNSTSSGNNPAGSGGGFPGFQNIQQVIQNGFQNISTSFTSLFNQGGGSNSSNNIFLTFGQNIGNFFNPTTASSGAQSDENSTNRPTIIQSIQNIFRPPFQQVQTNPSPSAGQQADQQPNRPIIQAIQSNPLVQTISGVFRPPVVVQTPAQQQPGDKPGQGSNIVPIAPITSESENTPSNVVKERPSLTPIANPVGPIQQALQHNRIAQNIAGTVQKLQGSLSNPERPRKIGHLVGHFGHGGHGGSHGGPESVVIDDSNGRFGKPFGSDRRTPAVITIDNNKPEETVPNCGNKQQPSKDNLQQTEPEEIKDIEPITTIVEKTD